MAPRNDAEAPGMSVSAAATRPPVSDSATATVWPRSCNWARTCPARSCASSPAEPHPTTTIAPPAGSWTVSLARGRLRTAQPHCLLNIVDTGGQGDDNGRGHDELADDLRRAERGGQYVQADRDDLQEGLQLAAAAGRDHAPADHPEPQHGHADLPEHDHAGDPPGQFAERRQADQGGPGERFVGHRVGD